MAMMTMAILALGIFVMPEPTRKVEDAPELITHLIPPNGKWAESYEDTLETRQVFNLYLQRQVLKELLDRVEALEKPKVTGPSREAIDPNE